MFFVSIRAEMSCFGSTSPPKVFYFEKSLQFRVPYSLSGVFWHMHNSPANILFCFLLNKQKERRAQINLFLHFHSFRVIKCTQFGKVPHVRAALVTLSINQAIMVAAVELGSESRGLSVRRRGSRGD